MKNKAITIYDIAGKLGVSPSTVNRALNSKAGVSVKTKDKVLKAAEEMHYKVNPMARGLKRTSTKIGFIVNECASEFQARVLEGAKAAYNELKNNNDFNLEAEFCIIPRGTTHRSMVNKINQMIDDNVEGLIFSPASVYGYEGVLRRLKENNIPVATVTSDIDSSDVLFSVRSNTKCEGRLAANLMSIIGIEKGRKVVIFTGRSENMGNKENIDSFLEANEEYDFLIESILDHQDDNEWAKKISTAFFKDEPMVDCVYISTPVVQPILNVMEQMGLLGKIKIITTDINPEIIGYIKEGKVVATLVKSAEKQGRIAFINMYEHLTEGKKVDRVNLINPKIVVKGNLYEF